MKKQNHLLIILILLITLSMTVVYFSPSILSGEKVLNNASNNLLNQANIKTEKVTVNNGDTLWNLARRYYDSNTDLRKVIFDIKEINNMSTSDIRPGQQIKIPLK